MIFQHGDTLDDYWMAHTLAKRSAEMGHNPGRWLAAAALDRWLLNQGKPQKYGTQFYSDGKSWRLLKLDPDTTDAERAEWNVLPVDEQIRMMHESYGDPPPPDQIPEKLRWAMES